MHEPMSSLLLIEVGSGIFSYEPTSDRFVKLSQFAHRCRFPYNLTTPPTRSVIIVMVGEISHHHHSSSLLHPWLRSRSLSTSSAASSFMYYGTYVIYCNQMSLIVAASRGRAREESFAITSEEKHRWKTVGNTGFEWEFRANFTAFTMSEGW